MLAQPTGSMQLYHTRLTCHNPFRSRVPQTFYPGRHLLRKWGILQALSYAPGSCPSASTTACSMTATGPSRPVHFWKARAPW